MTEAERAAREASAALNMLLLKGGSKLWPDDEKTLKAALNVCNHLTRG